MGEEVPLPLEHAEQEVKTGVVIEAKAIEEAVEAWYKKHFHGMGNRLELWLLNHLHAAKEDLKADLHKLLHP